MSTEQQPLISTHRSKVKRGRKRASYDRELVNQIIDQSLVAYIGCNFAGEPFVLPTSHWRDGDRLYWHAAAKGRMAEGMIDQQICVTFVLLDGLVYARSAFHHSVNYRSAMLFGKPELVTDPLEKARQLEIFIERIAPGRWSELRPMKENELKATGILSMRIEEGSIKMRAAAPEDDEEDYGWPVWAGVIPVSAQWGAAEDCPRLGSGFIPPAAPGNIA